MSLEPKDRSEKLPTPPVSISFGDLMSLELWDSVRSLVRNLRTSFNLLWRSNVIGTLPAWDDLDPFYVSISFGDLMSLELAAITIGMVLSAVFGFQSPLEI